jgi:phosphocarrier protein
LSSCSRTILITNRRGLHARASAKFVNLVSELAAKVEVEKDGNRVTGTSIMGLMMLGAAMGDTITIHCDGDDCGEAMEQMAAMVEGKFGED